VNFALDEPMGKILPFFRPARAFDPEMTIALIAAYEKALDAIENHGQTDSIRYVVARRIVALASKGERDPERLCAAVVAMIACAADKTRKPAVRNLAVERVIRRRSDFTALPRGGPGL
jgi:hypothetical protein